eukprot:TRINITY_DN2593_c0_g1_i1.p1 TRINITY_DN2593_c0_g1~~TRINITY_DN2593_c0_g1_i1.p1  ORF type:complete len:533 (+),score=171.27 TRINITY_DN2593_c0_g1_i1:231-1829(+)
MLKQPSKKPTTMHLSNNDKPVMCQIEMNEIKLLLHCAIEMELFLNVHRKSSSSLLPLRLQEHQDAPIRPSIPLTEVSFTTVDNTFAKWQKFDAEAAIQEADNNAPQQQRQARDVSDRDERDHSPEMTTQHPTSKFVSERILELKVKGNEQFKRKKFEAAIDLYTMGLRLGVSRKNEIDVSEWKELMTQCYGNRAMCYKKLSKLKECIEDCSKALKIDETYTKAWVRRASAQKALGNHSRALEDYERALELLGNATSADSNDERAVIVKEVQSLQSKVINKKSASPRSERTIEQKKNEDFVSEQKKETPAVVKKQEETTVAQKQEDMKGVKGEKEKATAIVKKQEVTTVVQKQEVAGIGTKMQEETAAKRNEGTTMAEKPEDLMNEEEKKEAASQKTEVKKSLPKKKITAAYEFENVFREVKDDPELVVQLLWQTPPANLKKLAVTIMDEEFMSTIIQSISLTRNLWSASQAASLLLLNALQGLTQVRRFSMIISFLEPCKLESLAEDLHHLNLTYPVLANQIGQICSAYHIG